MKPNLIRIATRRSPLAMWQSHHVKQRIESYYPEIKVELITFVTRGDKILDTSLAKIGGKGLFVKELEHALLAGDADIAVHSMKDVPMSFPEGLGLVAICEREDPSDAFVSNRFGSLAELPVGARVGTSSLRRQCQLRETRPDLAIQDLRGNVNTRLQRLDNGDYDAIILATAGLVRLEFADRIRERIPFAVSLPAGGQGAVGIEALTDNKPVTEILTRLHHEPTSLCVSAERAMNKWLEGGCQVPIAGFAELSGDLLTLRGLVGSPDGKQILRATLTGSKTDAETIGITVAKDLLSQGADKILQQVYANATSQIGSRNR